MCAVNDLCCKKADMGKKVVFKDSCANVWSLLPYRSIKSLCGKFQNWKGVERKLERRVRWTKFRYKFNLSYIDYAVEIGWLTTRWLTIVIWIFFTQSHYCTWGRIGRICYQTTTVSDVAIPLILYHIYQDFPLTTIL